MSKKVRVEIRFDEEKDKDIIDFMDEYGSTRAGFIKQVLRIYKNQIEGEGAGVNSATPKQTPPVTTTIENNGKDKRKRISRENDISFSSKEF
jgi:hypothetical protein